MRSRKPRPSGREQKEHPLGLVYSEALRRLEELRGARTALYIAEDRPPAKAIDEDDSLILYELLRRGGPQRRLDLVLHQFGGRVNASRRIALLLRSYAAQLHVLIPYKARSAATVLALASDQIVMGPLAELSPIDPQIAASGDPPAGTPALMSVEDIRAFRRMAEDWFGLQREEHAMQAFALLSQRLFPATLGNFFRADQQIRLIAEELLRFHLPEAAVEERRRVVQQLASGYYAHDYSITREEAQRLGLRVLAASAPEEKLLWEIWQGCRRLFEIPGLAAQAADETVDGVIASADFNALHVVRWAEVQPPPVPPGGRPARPARMPVEARWRIL
ncbi:MAG TPA: hypothetical protein VFS21_22260 [Roseiflexaceae bacterium]|nr:hypothetical protein [Roseiflexaceae bacterium]